MWSQRRDSNPRPSDYKSDALPAVLRWLRVPVTPPLMKETEQWGKLAAWSKQKAGRHWRMYGRGECHAVPRQSRPRKDGNDVIFSWLARYQNAAAAVHQP